MVLCLRPPVRNLSGRLPLGEPLVLLRTLRPPGPEAPFAFCTGDPLPFRTSSLLSAETFRSLSMVFVRVLSAMPKVPLLRAIPFFASGLEACRVLSSLLRPGIVRPASVLRVGLFAALPRVSREVMGLL